MKNISTTLDLREQSGGWWLGKCTERGDRSEKEGDVECREVGLSLFTQLTKK